MGDTKQGREDQADQAEERQRERELEEELTRSDEAPPEDPAEPEVCDYRGCNELATFRVLERYQEETGHGAVTAEAIVCQAHADEESPTNLDHAYDEYVFRVEPLSNSVDAETD